MTTIRIQLDTEKMQVKWTQNEILEATRDAFPDATSICLESEDGTSETIYAGKEK